MDFHLTLKKQLLAELLLKFDNGDLARVLKVKSKWFSRSENKDSINFNGYKWALSARNWAL